MNNVYMIEYQGRCDENGKAVGHAPKVLNEYYNFIKEYSRVTVLAPSTILKEFTGEVYVPKITLPKHIEMKGKTPFIEKITNKFNMFHNASKALKEAAKDDDAILWFFNVEYYIMLWFVFLSKLSSNKNKRIFKKIVLTMFIDGYHASKSASIKTKIKNNFKQWVFEQAQKKFDLIIATGEKFKYKNCESVFIPDYYYINEIYDKYNNIIASCDSTSFSKLDEAVCLGTMGRGKQLKEMVEAFSRIGYKLTVAGRFYDKELVKELKEIASDNIAIRDDYLSLDEYLTLLSKAKYTVLPYSPESYSFQTSGVMQEAMFLHTIPVTYSDILEGNCMKGIGFKSWNDLTKKKLDINSDDFIKYYDEKINSCYSKEYAIKYYESIFNIHSETTKK